MSTTNNDSLHFPSITSNNDWLHYLLLPPANNVVIGTVATKNLTLQYLFDAMEQAAWQYGHIPT